MHPIVGKLTEAEGGYIEHLKCISINGKLLGCQAAHLAVTADSKLSIS